MNLSLRVARLSLFLGCFLAVMALLCGCETMSGSGDRTALDGKGSDNTTSQGSSDVLHPGDIIIIAFSGATDPPARHDDRLREDGSITLPFVGSIKASGKTRAELQKEIQALYVPRYYRQLTVNVNPDTRYFVVSGEVKNPNRYLYVGRMSVLKAIASAGDFTDFANQKRVEIIRGNGKKVKVNCVKARSGGEEDLEIYPDDHIYVPRRIW
jgi:protein involved in polysaccharide export with SLBB domain